MNEKALECSNLNKEKMTLNLKRYHSTSEAQRVVREDGFGSAIVVLGSDAADERLDVELRGAGFLAGGVRTFQAAVRFPECGTLAQRRVLDVLKVLVQVGAGSGKMQSISLKS